MKSKVPVVLVGNKIDLRGRDNLTNERLKNEVMPIMDEFKVCILYEKCWIIFRKINDKL